MHLLLEQFSLYSVEGSLCRSSGCLGWSSSCKTLFFFTIINRQDFGYVVVVVWGVLGFFSSEEQIRIRRITFQQCSIISCMGCRQMCYPLWGGDVGKEQKHRFGLIQYSISIGNTVAVCNSSSVYVFIVPFPASSPLQFFLCGDIYHFT